MWEAACSDLRPDIPSVLLDRRNFVGEEITHLRYGMKIETETETEESNKDTRRERRREKTEIGFRPRACV